MINKQKLVSSILISATIITMSATGVTAAVYDSICVIKDTPKTVTVWSRCNRLGHGAELQKSIDVVSKALKDKQIYGENLRNVTEQLLALDNELNKAGITSEDTSIVTALKNTADMLESVNFSKVKADETAKICYNEAVTAYNRLARQFNARLLPVPSDSEKPKPDSKQTSLTRTIKVDVPEISTSYLKLPSYTATLLVSPTKQPHSPIWQKWTTFKGKTSYRGFTENFVTQKGFDDPSKFQLGVLGRYKHPSGIVTAVPGRDYGVTKTTYYGKGVKEWQRQYDDILATVLVGVREGEKSYEEWYQDCSTDNTSGFYYSKFGSNVFRYFDGRKNLMLPREIGSIEDELKDLKSTKQEDLLEYMRLSLIFTKVSGEYGMGNNGGLVGGYGENGRHASAYSMLFGGRRVGNCIGGAHLDTAVADVLGFNNAFAASTSHAGLLVHFNGKWRDMEAGNLGSELSALPSSVSRYNFAPPVFK